MNEENRKYLEENFPKIFSGKYGGLAVGDGWFNIIKNTCHIIQSHIDWKNDQKEKYGRGDGCTQVVAQQVKEKFGTLRFYYQGGDEFVRGVVDMAERMTGCTCEKCGDIGEQRGGGWIHVYCNTCEAEREMERSEIDDTP